MITSLTAGSVIGSTSPRIAWSPVDGAEKYYLYVGTTAGGKDVVDTGELAPSVLAYQPTDLPIGVPLFARLHVRVNGVWSVSGPDIPFSAQRAVPVTLDAPWQYMTWAGTQLVPGYTPGVQYPNYPLIANPAISSTPLPYRVPEGCWLGITYAYVSGKFGNHDRPGYLVLDGIGAVSEGGVPLAPAHPLFVGPGTGIGPYFINNTPGEAEYMTGIVQGTLISGIDPRARLTDVLTAFT